MISIINELRVTKPASEAMVLTEHPQKIADYLEEFWRLAKANEEENKTRLPAGFTALPGDKTPTPLEDYCPTYHHLIYAYMLENTRMVQIFYRVLQGFHSGEDLSFPSKDTRKWLRNTEMLFFRHLSGFYSFSTRSEVRPDPEATRRNAYYRMFGMDLGYGTQQDKPYPFRKATQANTGFSKLVERLLAEIHRAIINVANTSGTNSTDPSSIAKLSKELKNMLKDRRNKQNLAQEEFAAVAMMSWFEYTLKKEDFALWNDLNVTASSPEDKLIQLGQKVKLPANPKSGSFFELADLLSKWMLLTEAGYFDSAGQVKAALATREFREMMTEIITDWSLATGADIKGIQTGNKLQAAA
ncbi:hypothetical protein [Neolewinella agarilytica]|uniref:Uncharacterized protein n=1 Tax=Neolewinella agarilytica TaxID=478744 RepID=A0A1H9H827_9BACT|nr:hypothetical protein [Neolewinella agarilytica]SEQ58519.1 hypothetical protein SAMN05444359_11255 [Neolewinella agarilytica]